MSEVSASVEVGVDPQTAFRVFTEEIDLWWVRSPISFYDAARAVAKRIEPGVGEDVISLCVVAHDRGRVHQQGEWTRIIQLMKVDVTVAICPGADDFRRNG